MKLSTVICLLIVYGFFLYGDNIQKWLNPPPAITNAAANNEVILYSTTWCGYCAKTRKYLTENHIRYNDIDVEHSERGRIDYARMGSGVPIVVINNETFIRGYSPERMSEALSNTKKPATQ
jgi:mycoredoxin